MNQSKMKIDQNTTLFGVVGFPLGHTLSPVMHNAAFEATGLNAVYLAFPTKDPEGCVRGMRALGIRGLSVTLPLKSAVLPFLDEVDPLAKMIGAVNTVVNDRGRLVGYNTDASGALKAMEERTALPNKRCLILGAGGAARAIGFILREKGVALCVANRSHQRGKELALSLQCPYIGLDEMEGRSADLLVQTTPVGMAPHVEESIVPESILRPHMVVMDIVYNPVETKLLRMARARGCVTVSGLRMFLYQGAEQFSLWTGIEPPVEAMRLAVEKALREGHEGN